jgi:hypothetical protein
MTFLKYLAQEWNPGLCYVSGYFDYLAKVLDREYWTYSITAAVNESIMSNNNKSHLP